MHNDSSLNKYILKDFGNHSGIKKKSTINCESQDKQQPTLSSFRDDMVIRRARIRHTYLTHKCLKVKEDQPLCNTCNELLTYTARL